MPKRIEQPSEPKPYLLETMDLPREKKGTSNTTYDSIIKDFLSRKVPSCRVSIPNVKMKTLQQALKTRINRDNLDMHTSERTQEGQGKGLFLVVGKLEKRKKK